MSDIVAELRERALQAEQDGEPIALLDEAAGEIEKLRSWVRLQDAVIHSGNVAALTEAERKAVERLCEATSDMIDDDKRAGGFHWQDDAAAVAVVRGLLERLG